MVSLRVSQGGNWLTVVQNVKDHRVILDGTLGEGLKGGNEIWKGRIASATSSCKMPLKDIGTCS